MYILTNSASRFATSAGISPYWVVAENGSQEQKGQRILEKYLAEGATLLQKEIALLADTTRPVTATQLRRLDSMLVLLKDARTAWQEEDASIRVQGALER